MFLIQHAFSKPIFLRKENRKSKLSMASPRSPIVTPQNPYCMDQDREHKLLELIGVRKENRKSKLSMASPRSPIVTPQNPYCMDQDREHKLLELIGCSPVYP